MMRTKDRLKTATLAALCAMLVAAVPVVSTATEADDDAYLELSLEDLLDVEVTSVAKRPQSLHDAAAAIYVLSGEDLRRSGVTHVAEALRRVPGLQVARIDANKWSVTARGFTGRFANKLLVLVDGRSVYTSSFSGVYWELQDLMIEDIARIEVIRGPGSTLWGANAVNGVINIITRHAADSQDGTAVVAAGDRLDGLAGVRWGTRLGDKTYARFYGRGLQHGAFDATDGSDAGDSWQMAKAGFRMDVQRSATEALTLQGDAYGGTIDQQAVYPTLLPPYEIDAGEEIPVRGGNLLGRWTRTLSPTSDFALQVYVARSEREENLAGQYATQVEYDFQHNFSADRHRVVWGLTYRYVADEITAGIGTPLDGDTRQLNLFGGFIQDEYSFDGNRLALILGSKFEHNDFTGFEVQPTVRLMWRPGDDHRVWTAVSRAVRTPARTDDDVSILAVALPPGSPANPAPLPVGFAVTGQDGFASETLLAYEAGYRFITSSASFDVALFYNDYDDLQSVVPGAAEVRFMADPPHIYSPAVFMNEGAAQSWGAEAAFAWQAGRRLRWDLAYGYYRQDDDLEGAPGSVLEEAPEHTFTLSCNFKPARDWDLFLALRSMDEVVSRGLGTREEHRAPGYTTLDVNLGWQAGDRVGISLAGYNLLEEQHVEYVAERFIRKTAVPRSVAARVSIGF